MEHAEPHSPWWPLQWIYLLFIAATLVAGRGGKLSEAEWGPFPLIFFCLPLVALLGRDCARLYRGDEPRFYRTWRAVSLLFATACVALLWSRISR
jgi:hypothetical protein